jgi:hypothetical protein
LSTPIPVPASIAREAGILVPVSISPAVWERCVAWTSTTSNTTGIYQDQEGRLWDVLWMVRRAIGARPNRADRARVLLHCWSPTDRMPIVDDAECGPPLVELVASCGFAPQGQPTILINFPAEETS